MERIRDQIDLAFTIVGLIGGIFTLLVLSLIEKGILWPINKLFGLKLEGIFFPLLQMTMMTIMFALVVSNFFREVFAPRERHY